MDPPSLLLAKPYKNKISIIEINKRLSKSPESERSSDTNKLPNYGLGNITSQDPRRSFDKSIDLNKIFKDKEEYESFMFYQKFISSQSEYERLITNISNIEKKISENNNLIKELKEKLVKLKEEKKEKKINIIHNLSNKESLEEIYKNKIESLIYDKTYKYNKQDIMKINVNDIKTSDKEKYQDQIILFAEDVVTMEDDEDNFLSKIKQIINSSYQNFETEINSTSFIHPDRIVTNFFSRICLLLSNQSLGNYSDQIINVFLRILLKINSIGVETTENYKFLKKKYKEEKNKMNRQIIDIQNKNENMQNKMISYEKRKYELENYIEDFKERMKHYQKSPFNIKSIKRQNISYNNDNSKNKTSFFETTINKNENDEGKDYSVYNQNQSKIRQNFIHKEEKVIKNSCLRSNLNDRTYIGKNVTIKKNNILSSKELQQKNKSKILGPTNKYTIKLNPKRLNNHINFNNVLINNNIKIENNNIIQNNNKSFNYKKLANNYSLEKNDHLIKNITNSNYISNDSIGTTTIVDKKILNKNNGFEIIYDVNREKNNMLNNSNNSIRNYYKNLKKFGGIISLNYKRKPIISVSPNNDHISKFILPKEKVIISNSNYSPRETMNSEIVQNIYPRKSIKNNHIIHGEKKANSTLDNNFGLFYSKRYDNHLITITKNLKETFCYYRIQGKNKSLFNPLDNNATNPEKFGFYEGYIYIEIFNHKFRIEHKNNKKKQITIDLLKIDDIKLTPQMAKIEKICKEYLKFGKEGKKIEINKFLNSNVMKKIDMTQNEKIKSAFCNFFTFSIIFNEINLPKIEFILVSFENYNTWYNCIDSIKKLNRIHKSLVSPKEIRNSKNIHK